MSDRKIKLWEDFDENAEAVCLFDLDEERFSFILREKVGDNCVVTCWEPKLPVAVVILVDLLEGRMDLDHLKERKNPFIGGARLV